MCGCFGREDWFFVLSSIYMEDIFNVVCGKMKELIGKKIKIMQKNAIRALRVAFFMLYYYGILNMGAFGLL